MGNPSNPPRNGDIRSTILAMVFFLLLAAAVAGVFFYLNQDNELLPEAHPGGGTPAQELAPKR